MCWSLREEWLHPLWRRQAWGEASLTGSDYSSKQCTLQGQAWVLTSSQEGRGTHSGTFMWRLPMIWFWVPKCTSLFKVQEKETKGSGIVRKFFATMIWHLLTVFYLESRNTGPSESINLTLLFKESRTQLSFHAHGPWQTKIYICLIILLSLISSFSSELSY